MIEAREQECDAVVPAEFEAMEGGLALKIMAFGGMLLPEVVGTPPSP